MPWLGYLRSLRILGGRIDILLIRIFTHGFGIHGMRLCILLTHGHRLISVSAIVDLFETVNRYLEGEARPPMFQIEFVGLNDQTHMPDALRRYPYSSVRQAKPSPDWVMVPAFGSEDFRENLERSAPLVPFLVEQHRRGALLASFCTGAFLLAIGGVLNGREATTHVDAADAFAGMFPQVRLQPHAVVTQSGKVYTSGGATSSFHLMLHLVEQFCGREMAVRAAKYFAVDMDRSTQLYFDRFLPELSKEDKLVSAVQVAIKDRYHAITNVEDVLDGVPSSRRNLIRRFKQSTGMTPIRYLQRTRIEAAKLRLETTGDDIYSVMEASGYSDIKNFRQLFKKFTGLTPKEYRNKYGVAR